jgi:phosphoribosylanthranilate isomerase
MHHPTVEAWTRVRTVFAPDWLQTDTEDFDELDLEDCKPLPVFRTRLNPSVDKWPAHVLFESPRSGSGEKADWQEAAWMATKTRVILAGGLNSSNIVTAVQSVKPWGVDVSSGVESARGIKDQKKIRGFIARIRSMENNDGAR